MKRELSLKNLVAQKGEKVQGLVKIYDTDYSIPVTLINGKEDGKSILITAGIHGGEYPCIQTAIELANEIDPNDVYGNIIIIHPVNTTGFKEKISAVVPEDNKNLNRVFPGNINGSISEKIAHFLSYECQDKADFYVDMHGGDLHEFVTDYVYYPGVGDEEIVKQSKEIASILDMKYMVKSTSTTGAYNSAAIRGIPSILIERGGRGLWSKEEVIKYKKDIKRVLNKLNILNDFVFDNENFEETTEITNAIYLQNDIYGCWYPEVKPGDIIKKGDLLGSVKDFFGNTLNTYYSEINGVVLYMTVSLSVKPQEYLIAYGK